MSQSLELLKRGLAHQKQGDFLNAENVFRQVLSSEPENIHALNLLGVVCVNTQRPQEAVSLIEQALNLRPQDPQALCNYALALVALKRSADAEQALKQALALRRENPVALDALANIHLDAGKLNEAEALYKEALSLNQQAPDCWCNLSSALQAQKRLDEALYAADRALSLQSDNPHFLYRKAEIFQSDAKFSEAMIYYKKAIAQQGDYLDAQIGLAHAYRQTEQPQAAMDILDALLNRHAEDGRIVYAKAVLLEQMGQLEEAALFAQRAIDVSPEDALYHYQLAQLKGRKSLDHEKAALDALAETSGEATKNADMLWYALGKINDERGAGDQAFSCWQKANHIRLKANPYDEAYTETFYQALLKHTEQGLERRFQLDEPAEQTPIFVVGMPRSGNTLTGQIIAGHSAVENVGEVGHVSDALLALGNKTGESFPEIISNLNAEKIQFFRKNILPKYGEGSSRVVDNTPLNFQYIGILALALPKAKFVLCHRDPVDACFSIYKLPFSGPQSYAHDLHALGHQYQCYQNLMDGWHKLLPGRILNVCYEETVADVEAQSRQLLSFLELPFEQDVLNFHQSKRLVRTPSASQVRQPIYKTAVQAWKKYEDHLGPLLEALGAVR